MDKEVKGGRCAAAEVYASLEGGVVTDVLQANGKTLLEITVAHGTRVFVWVEGDKDDAGYISIRNNINCKNDTEQQNENR